MTSELVVWTLSAAQALHEMRTQFTTGGVAWWEIEGEGWESEMGEREGGRRKVHIVKETQIDQFLTCSLFPFLLFLHNS